MKKAVVYTLSFLMIQLIAQTIVQGLWLLVKGRETLMSPTVLVVMTLLSSVATIAVFLYFRWATVSRDYAESRPWGVLVWTVLAALGCLVPSLWLQELMPELPESLQQFADDAERQMGLMMNTRLGYFVVGLLVPVTEELVFRGAVLRSLLQWFPRPWVCIGVSAVVFALVHINPAQMPHAFVIGLLLGWLYYRTGSILPGVVFHAVNNTAAFVLYRLYPDSSITLTDILGSQRSVLMAVGFSLCILLPSLLQLHQRMHRAH